MANINKTKKNIEVDSLLQCFFEFLLKMIYREIIFFRSSRLE